MTILQIKEASGLFSEVAQLGVVFGLLVAIIFVLAWLVVKLYKESKEKSTAHGVTLAAKDKKIEDMNEERRNDSIDTIGFVKDLQETIKELIVEIKISR